MSGLELVLAIAGVGITMMVVVGMFLIVPGGVEPAPVHVADPVPPDPVKAEAPRGVSGEPVSTT